MGNLVILEENEDGIIEVVDIIFDPLKPRELENALSKKFGSLTRQQLLQLLNEYGELIIRPIKKEN